MCEENELADYDILRNVLPHFSKNYVLCIRISSHTLPLIIDDVQFAW